MSSGWPRQYPILQAPNAPVLVAWAFRLAARSTDGRARAVAEAGSQAALAVWAYGELASGANAVPRALGAIGLGYVAARVTRRLSEP
jgi:hypothetical protein